MSEEDQLLEASTHDDHSTWFILPAGLDFTNQLFIFIFIVLLCCEVVYLISP